jgi:hypothetical protein
MGDAIHHAQECVQEDRADEYEGHSLHCQHNNPRTSEPKNIGIHDRKRKNKRARDGGDRMDAEHHKKGCSHNNQACKHDVALNNHYLPRLYQHPQIVARDLVFLIRHDEEPTHILQILNPPSQAHLLEVIIPLQ